MLSREILTASEEETVGAGERLGASLRPGDVVLLSGELGAGKTAFVRGLARGLGAAPDDVSSPTFTLIQEYRGGARRSTTSICIDFEPAEVADLGLDELVSGGGIVAIEWAERWDERPADAIEVRIEDSGEDRRQIRIERPA